MKVEVNPDIQLDTGKFIWRLSNCGKYFSVVHKEGILKHLEIDVLEIKTDGMRSEELKAFINTHKRNYKIDKLLNE
jgi:hypothetical protein